MKRFIYNSGRKVFVYNGEFREEDHPRGEDGKFGGGSDKNKIKLKEWAKDSKIRNPDGSLKKVYHGTPKEFDEIDQEKSSGMIWLTGNKEYADYFSGEKRKTREIYADIKDPLDISDLKDEENLSFWQEKLEEFGIDTNNIDWEEADWASDYGAYAFFDLLPHAGNNYIDTGVLDAIKKAGFDGLIAPPEENDGVVSDYNLVAFDKDQLKEANKFENSVRVYRVARFDWMKEKNK